MDIQDKLAQAAVVVRGQVSRLQKLDSTRLAQSLEQTLQTNEEFRSNLRLLLKESSALGLLTESGIAGDRGFLGDLIHAVKTRVLPKSVSLRDIDFVYQTLFPGSTHRKWLTHLDPETLEKCSSIIQSELGQDIWTHIRSDYLDALELLSTQVASKGLSPVLRAYIEKFEKGKIRKSLHQSSFYRLQKQIRFFVDSIENGTADSNISAAALVFDELVACRSELTFFSSEMETSGVSIDVVSRLQVIQASLARIEEILPLLGGTANEPADHLRFIAKMVRMRERDLRFRRLFQNHLSLIARKITEHAGEKGEHYVTRTRKEFKAMFFSAFGAGALTAITCLLKPTITSLEFALLWETALHAANYSISFIVLYHLGFSLATKQSSMTAAHLADALKNDPKRAGGVIGELASQISRSQIIAVLGNVMAVMPMAAGIAFLYYFFFDVSLLSLEKALKTLEAFDFLNPTTWLFAAVTGVILWTASLFSGLAENFSIFYRLPQTLAQHAFSTRIQFPVASRIMGWFAPKLKKHLSGWSSNVSLGILLTLPALLGRMIGIAADVRHVTLGAGLVVMAVCSLIVHRGFEYEAAWGWMTIRALIGVLLVGAINILVSFVISLTIALLARNEPLARTFWVMRAIFRQLRLKPKPFFVPPS